MEQQQHKKDREKGKKKYVRNITNKMRAKGKAMGKKIYI